MPNKNTTEDSEESELLVPKPRMIRSKRDFFLILSMQSLYLASYCVASTIGPFYTLEVEARGSNTIIGGLVFAAYPFIIFILSPIVGKYLPKLGPVTVLAAGSLMEGTGEILFGFIALLTEQWLFVLLSFLLRILTAIGAAFSQIAIISILCCLYPNHISISFGMLELASGVGLMIGPTLGGFLYHVGGFKLPFIVVGSFVMLALIIVMATLPRNQIRTPDDDETVVSILGVTKVIGVAIVGMCIVTGGILISFFESTIAVQLDHITNGKFTKAQIGAYFVFATGFYTVSAPLWGCIVEHKLSGNNAMIIGHILALVSFLLMGPVPFLQPVFTATPISTAISLCVLGISMGPFLVPVISAMQMYAIESGLENGLSLNSIISGLFASCVNIGSIIGPIIGGLFLHYSTFSWACLLLVIIILIEGIALSMFSFCKSCKEQKEEQASNSDTLQGLLNDQNYLKDENL